MTRSRPQDALIRTTTHSKAHTDAGAHTDTPLDAAHVWIPPNVTGHDDDALEAGWYPSPDGAPTLSWWTGQGGSRTQQPVPAR